MKFELMTEEEKRRRLEEPLEEVQEVQEEIPQPVEQLEAPIAVSEPEAPKRFDYASEMDALNQEYEARRAAAEPKKRGFGRILADAVVGALAGRQGSQEILNRRDEKTEAEKKQVLQDFLNKRGFLRDRAELERLHTKDEIQRELNQTKQQLADSRITSDQLRRDSLDPNSAYSLAKVKNLAEVHGIDPAQVVGKLSAAEAEKYVAELGRNTRLDKTLEARGSDRQSRENRLDKTLEIRKGEKQNKEISDLRKELTSGTRGEMLKEANSLRKVKSLAEAYLKDPKAQPYVNVAVMLSGAKALQGDDSVVRQPEMRAMQEAGDVATKLMAQVRQAGTGDALSQVQKQQLVDALTTMSRIADKAYMDIAKPAISYAERNNLPLAEILGEGFLEQKKAVSSADDLENKKKRLAELKAKKAGQ
jgi:hypothetical protein